MSNNPEDTFQKEFTDACAAGNVEGVERMLEQWKKSFPGQGATAISDHPLQAGLIAAAESGQGEVVRSLLNSGFEVSPDVILAASESGSTQVFQAMIDCGWDINQSAGHTGDALSHAAADDGTDLARFLLEHGADPNKNERAGMWTALDLAVMHASPATAQLLIDHGAAIQNTNALIIAAQDGRIDMLELLLNNGAKVDEVPENDLPTEYKGLNALQVAEKENHQ
ncbi:ankyrin [Agrocybe pediades]|nr:ankyrin [Agrocybe pediades]